MPRQKALIVRVGHDADGQDVEIPLSYPGHRPVAQVANAAVETGGGAQSCNNLPICCVVKHGIDGIVIIWYQVGQFLGGGQMACKTVNRL